MIDMTPEIDKASRSFVYSNISKVPIAGFGPMLREIHPSWTDETEEKSIRKR